MENPPIEPTLPTPRQPNTSHEVRESTPNFQDLVLFTTTLYGTDPISKVREKLALKLFENAAELGVRCIVVDGGSNQSFLEKLRQFDSVETLIETTLKMGEGRRQALKQALAHQDANYFLWVEPEKDSLVNKDSLGSMIKGLRQNQVDIVVPRRISKKSMPKFQAWIESRANKRAGRLLPSDINEPDQELDLWFGPKMFNRDGARFFAEYQGNLDKWDSVIKPVLEAAQAGKRISSVEVDYDYDLSQSESEETNVEIKRKRLDQYTKILTELGDDFWRRKKGQ